MGLRGERIKSSNRYAEPNLLIDVASVSQNAKDNGFYIGESLDIEKVISTFSDIKVVYEEMEPNQSGSIKKVGDEWLICVNNRHHKHRQKFTLAHELGHYILHRGKQIDIVDTTFFRNNDVDSMEYMANEFASNLLMPKEQLEKLILNGCKNIGDLADKFQVSASAMKYRIISLGYKLKDNV